MSKLSPASVFDREGEIPVPAKVWVFFAQARAMHEEDFDTCMNNSRKLQ